MPVAWYGATHCHIRSRKVFAKNDFQAGALEHFSHDAAKYVLLLDPSLQYVPLDSADVERLYTLCDYGAMSTDRIPDDIFNTSTNASTASDFFLNVDFVEPVTTVGIRDFGSNIPSTEQEYGHHDIDRTTQLEDPSSSLDTSERTVSMAPDHIWSYT
jgi:hypothetical protein